MVSAFIGIVTALFVTIYAFMYTSPDTTIFADRIGIMIVIGGTFSAASITFNFRQLRYLGRNIIRVFTRVHYDNKDTIADILSVSQKVHKNPGSVGAAASEVDHPFLADGLRLIENDFSRDQIADIMHSSIIERKNAHLGHVDVLRTLAKYPPAFGMIGTVIGLVALLQGLATESGIEKIGPNMAVALITTLYGLLLANFIFLPMSENVFNKIKADVQVRKIILKGVLLICDGEDPVIIQETLNTYLHPNRRGALLPGNFSGSSDRDAA